MSTRKERSDAARVLGSKGWSKGGKARAAKLPKWRRLEIARKASRAAAAKRRRQREGEAA